MQTAKSGKEKKLNKIVPVLLVLAAAGIFLIACRLLRLENRGMTRSAVTAALYVVLCTLFSPISFGAVQLRVADALALLPAMLGVGAGELVSCLVLGVAMVRVIEASPTLRRLAEGEKV